MDMPGGRARIYPAHVEVMRLFSPWLGCADATGMATESIISSFGRLFIRNKSLAMEKGIDKICISRYLLIKKAKRGLPGHGCD